MRAIARKVKHQQTLGFCLKWLENEGLNERYVLIIFMSINQGFQIPLKP